MKNLHLLLIGLALVGCRDEEPTVTDETANAEAGASGSGRDGTGVDLPTDRYARPEPGEEVNAPEPAAYWYDGDRRREVLESEGLVAEFLPSEGGKTRILQAAPDATEVSTGTDGVRLWRVGDQADVAEMVRGLNEATEAPSFSPVFSEGPTDVGGKCALAGGVNVRFPGDWSTEAIEAFLAKEGLEGNRIGDIGSTWLVESAPGMESLELANRLHEAGEVQWASPNWWREVSTR